MHSEPLQPIFQNGLDRPPFSLRPEFTLLEIWDDSKRPHLATSKRQETCLRGWTAFRQSEIMDNEERWKSS